jgi:hypothetical protein
MQIFSDAVWEPPRFLLRFEDPDVPDYLEPERERNSGETVADHRADAWQVMETRAGILVGSKADLAKPSTAATGNCWHPLKSMRRWCQDLPSFKHQAASPNLNESGT